MRYILGVLAVVVVAFLAIFAIVNRGENTATNPPSKTATRLASLANDNTEVSLTTRGHLTGDDTFRSIRVRITAGTRVVEILRGYDKTVERSQVFDNSQTAFTDLLFALDNAGFTRKQTARYTDARGVCPLGTQYTYTYTTADGEKHELWSTSCAASDGNFAGSGSVVRQVMQNQITGYSKFVSGVQL